MISGNNSDVGQNSQTPNYSFSSLSSGQTNIKSYGNLSNKNPYEIVIKAASPMNKNFNHNDKLKDIGVIFLSKKPKKD